MTENILIADPTLRGNVQRVLDYLASRLEPIIATRLAAKLGGLQWTEILRQLDSMKGRAHREHSPTDLQAQLRMLTERLGGLGYPFDDERRNVSRLGSELRLVRNTLAHGGSFVPVDAWRAHDTASRLLEVLGDAEAAAACAVLRDELQPLLPGGVPAPAARASLPGETEAGVPEVAVFELGSPPVPPPWLSDTTAEVEGAAAQAVPDTEVFERLGATATPTIGQARMSFEAWEVAIVGKPDVLDTLRRIDSKEQLRALAAEIVDFEGPIHVDRLTAHIAKSFDVGKLHAKRQRGILHQLAQCDFVIDADSFAWPQDLDPSSWAEFRPSSDPSRAFLHVSPIELANAARFLRERHAGESGAEIDRRVLRTFGRKRLTKQFREHLEREQHVPARPPRTEA